MEAFEVDGLEASRARGGAALPRVPAPRLDERRPVRAARPRGRSADAARPGRALLRDLGPGPVPGRRATTGRSARAAMLFVEAGVEHRFHTITQDLSVLVVFAPPEA